MGSISRIAPAARLDDQVKVFDVEIALDELGRELRTGMTANIEVRGEIREQVLAIPVESVFVRGEEEVVYVLRDTPLPKSEPADDVEDTEDTEGTETAEGDKSAEQPSAEEKWRDDPRQEWRRFYEERRVVTGIASTTDVEIVEGLEDGEKVALADPSKPKEENS
jgi:hypothetical protein